MFLTSKLITCFIDGFNLKRRSQSIAYLLNESEHIHWIWTLKLKCTQYGLHEQAAFKNTRALLFLRSRAERTTIFSQDLANLVSFLFVWGLRPRGAAGLRDPPPALGGALY